MLSFARKLFGSSNDRTVRRLTPKVNQINALEPQMQSLDDAALKAKTGEFRARGPSAWRRAPRGRGTR
ncbi:MAG: hypothetical protein ACQRW7_02880, partial [Caulobacterales bacterium]|uniref:hypothetical protein n=1 Tax=Glycocaulis sp. TaxID=1969725 RepID=UPI003F9ED8A7